jgi:FixJ family two-component response regulator
MNEEIVSPETDTTFVVDDDAGIRMAIESLLTSLGHNVETFRSAEEFVERRRDQAGCLVLDVRLPGTSGLQLQKLLKDQKDRIPIIFITGHADVSMAVQAIKAGATDFLVKPFREQDLLDAVQAALRLDRRQREEDFKFATYSERYRSLTEREREIMQHVVTGQMNKQIAASIGLSDVTVKIHRAQVMRKMGVNSLAELVRVADLVTPIGHALAAIR